MLAGRSFLDEPLVPLADRWLSDPDNVVVKLASQATALVTPLLAQTAKPPAGTPTPRAAADRAADAMPFSPSLSSLALGAACAWFALSTLLATSLVPLAAIAVVAYAAAGVAGVVRVPDPVAKAASAMATAAANALKSAIGTVAPATAAPATAAAPATSPAPSSAPSKP